jgi:hypothetical protein
LRGTMQRECGGGAVDLEGRNVFIHTCHVSE